jgi:hypothetical protein
MILFWLLLTLSFVLLAWPKNNISAFFNLPRKTIIILFSLKLAMGFLLSWVYAEHYQDRSIADTYKYFDDAGKFYEVFKKEPSAFFDIIIGSEDLSAEARELVSETHNWYPVSRRTFYNDNRTIIRMNALFSLITGHYYWSNLLLFLWIAFLGQLLLFKIGLNYLSNRKVEWLIVCFLFPSVMFWTSGILKEAPLLFLTGLLLFQFTKYREKLSWWRWGIVGLSIFSLIYIKFYVVLFMIPAALILMQLEYIKIGRKQLLLGNAVLWVLIAQVWHWIHPRWSAFTILKWKKNDFVGLARVMDANSFLKTYPLEDNLWSFLLNIPQGIVNTFLRPFPWEVKNLMMTFATVENIILFILMLIFFKQKEKWSNVSIACLLYALAFSAIIGMITPIAGSLVRYKVPLLFFIFFAILKDSKGFSAKSIWHRIKMKIEHNFLEKQS